MRRRYHRYTYSWTILDSLMPYQRYCWSENHLVNELQFLHYIYHEIVAKIYKNSLLRILLSFYVIVFALISDIHAYVRLLNYYYTILLYIYIYIYIQIPIIALRLYCLYTVCICFKYRKICLKNIFEFFKSMDYYQQAFS